MVQIAVYIVNVKKDSGTNFKPVNVLSTLNVSKKRQIITDYFGTASVDSVQT